MRIVQVIHGYPPRYNAGSEVYTQSLCRALSARHDVHVFTREEDPFRPDYAVRVATDCGDPRVRLHIVNVARSRDRYRHTGVDQRFAELLELAEPDVIHIGHLNHLSTSLAREAADRGVPIIFTIHDFWLMCPRGQFIQMQPAASGELWAACDGQSHEKCARNCYARYYSGAEEERAEDIAYWTRWVERRMRHVRDVAELVDVFIAPSETVLRRFRDEHGVPEAKLVHLDYGFDLSRLRGRGRQSSEPFTFGYIGTHIPSKGIQLLLEAFGRLGGHSRLRIWGRPRAHDTAALHALAASLPNSAGERVEWLPEYTNEHIVRDVFDHVDAIVVPSIWVENSPLVIHEALAARVPVITANAGGMGELIQHEVNGLTFDFRNASSLAQQMGRLASEPAMAAQLGARGYLATSGDVIGIDEHTVAIEHLYATVIARRDSARVSPLPGPWRVTFDTNPDTCNLKCVMCEEHSEHSLLQVRRKEAGKPRRLMPLELIRKVIAEAAPHGLREVIPSTMGEPLLYEDFEQILDLVRQYGVKLNLTTNGTFPRLGARRWAELIVPVTSDVKISWNGATAKTHEAIMVGARWDTVLENVRAFVAVRDEHAAAGGNRCRVTFQLTFLETNVPELAAIVRLAAALGVDRVKGHHLWAHFSEIESLSMRRDPEAIRRWNAAVVEAREVAAETRLPNGRPVLLEGIFVLDESAPANLAPGGVCPFLGQEAWISAEGRFDPCCAPDAQRRTLGELGSLHDRSLMETWRSDDYRSLVASYRTRPLCLGCNMRRPAGAAV